MPGGGAEAGETPRETVLREHFAARRSGHFADRRSRSTSGWPLSTRGHLPLHQGDFVPAAARGPRVSGLLADTAVGIRPETVFGGV
ncbi:NUDIX hydrolase [Streptomyces sp. NPDC088387]|uniref:NUDIX hydrolase n=1 Tax=Streptomyces sp. NPDC088387 TaxID=3365859 RepID=UPI0038139B01